MASNAPSTESTLTLRVLKKVLKCVYAGECVSDINSYEEIQYHMLDCLHAICINCFPKDKRQTGKRRCTVCGVTSDLKKFERCFYMEKVLDLYRYSNPFKGKCHLCNRKGRTEYRRCNVCSMKECKDCSVNPHKCPPHLDLGVDLAGSEGHQSVTHVVSFVGFDAVLSQCVLCTAGKQGSDKKVMCCLHDECRGKLFCEPHCYNEGHAANPLNIDAVHKRVAEIWSRMRDDIPQQTQLAEKASQDYELHSKNEGKFVLKLLDEYTEELVQNHDYRSVGVSEMKAGNIHPLDSLETLKLWTAEGHDELHAELTQKAERLRNEELQMKCAKQLLEYYKRVQFHIDLILNMCRNNRVIECYAWESIATALNRGTQNFTSSPRFEFD